MGIGGGGGVWGRRTGEQQNTSDRHALWVTLPGIREQQRGTGTNSTSMSVEELVEKRTEEANNYYTDIFCFMGDLNEYVYLIASRIFVFVTVRKGKVRTVSVERQHICRHHGCVNSAEKIRLSYQLIHCWHNFYTQVKVWISFVTFHI